MQEKLSQVARSISELFRIRSRRFHFSSMMVKAVFVTGGAAVATGAQFVTWSASPSASQITGLAASIVVFLGGLFVVFTESDASKELAAAQSALNLAEDAVRSTSWVDGLKAEFERLIELTQATSIMTSLVRESTLVNVGADIKLAQDFIRLVGRALTIAAGFEQNDRWTICIYRAAQNPNTQKYELKCVAHHRAIQCEIDQARVWPEGTGVVGVSFYTRSRQVIPDMMAPELENILNVGAPLRRDNDDIKYRSMAAYPIISTSSEIPWGVATATSDRKNHFNHDSGKNVNHDLAIKVLAEFMALAISMRDAHSRHGGSAISRTS